MIRALTGTLVMVDPITRAALVRVEASGLEYEVLLPAYFAEALAAGRRGSGEPVTFRTLHTLESATQGASFVPRLIGFPHEADRRFFELFTTVKGLGAKRALKALTQPPAQVATWIAARDTRALQRLPEIGARLAETIVAELAGKTDAFAGSGSGAVASEVKPARSARPTGAMGDAVATLMALGDSAADAERRVDQALARLGPGPHAADVIVQAALGG